jgi:hypothetical protein
MEAGYKSLAIPKEEQTDCGALTPCVPGEV